MEANFAIGNPVALLASAEERETRGFISITIMRPSAGSMANWTFAPPVSTPISRMMASAASRMAWYSRSERVWAGATVMESPVCTPMGSRFSIEQTTTQLSLRSRITSSSYSFQPIRLFSIRIFPAGERRRPRRAIVSNSSRLKAIPPPEPASVKAGRITHGSPMRPAAARASSRLVAISEGAFSSPQRVTHLRNWSRSSARQMTW